MMSKFQDMVARDNKNVFISEDEFATEHNINGDLVYIVLDTDTYKDNKFKGVMNDGVYLNHISFFVAENVLGYRPVENSHMNFDGDPCVVATCTDDLGILHITLEINRS